MKQAEDSTIRGLKRVIECAARKSKEQGGGRGKEGCKQVNGRDRGRRGANEPVGWRPERDASGDTRSNSRHE